MDRKGIIAIVLSLIFLVFWHFKTQQELREYQAAQAAVEAAAQAAATPAAPAADGSTPAIASPGTGASVATPATAPVPTPAVEKKEDTVTTPAVAFTFTNLGGGIDRAELLTHEGRNDEEPLVLNPHASHPIGAILYGPSETDLEPYSVSVNGNVVTATRTDATGLEVTKTYIFPEADKGAAAYSVDLKVTFANRGSIPLEKAGYYLFVGSVEPLHADEYTHYTGFDWYRNGDAERITVDWFAEKSFLGFNRTPAKDLYSETPGGGVLWAGVRGQYFTSLISTKGTPGVAVAATRFPITIEEKSIYGIQGALGMPGFKLAPGEVTSQEVVIYAGPKAYTLLNELPQYESEIIGFNWFIKPICIVLLQGLTWLYGLLGSYAWAIIVLTFIVRGALWPVQAKATRSMKQMSLLQPKMVELKAKYKDDPTRMNQEMMKLYKDYKINPLAGCLPLLIQIPIFFGFFYMLGSAVELRNQSFLWVTDLSRPDTIATIAGFPINILPILMTATMILQMQLSPKSGDALQQRIMMFMPLMFVVFTYNFASALALYYTVQNILSIIQLYVMRNEKPPTLEKAVVLPPERKKKR